MPMPRKPIAVNDEFGERVVVELMLDGTLPKPSVRVRCNGCGSEKVMMCTDVRSTRRQRCGGCRLSRSKKRTHGESRNDSTPEYRTWKQINGRCHSLKNSRYSDYGGRGIYVCDQWRGVGGYERFRADMGRRPSGSGAGRALYSLGRKDNDGPYSKSNCAWETHVEQANNKRNSRLITARNKTQSVTLWGRETGVSIATLRQRVRRGVDGAAAISAIDSRTEKSYAAWGRALLSFLAGVACARVVEIARALCITVQLTSSHLGVLLRRGHIRKLTRGRYALAPGVHG